MTSIFIKEDEIEMKFNSLGNDENELSIKKLLEPELIISDIRDGYSEIEEKDRIIVQKDRCGIALKIIISKMYYKNIETQISGLDQFFNDNLLKWQYDYVEKLLRLCVRYYFYTDLELYRNLNNDNRNEKGMKDVIRTKLKEIKKLDKEYTDKPEEMLVGIFKLSNIMNEKRYIPIKYINATVMRFMLTKIIRFLFAQQKEDQKAVQEKNLRIYGTKSNSMISTNVMNKLLLYEKDATEFSQEDLSMKSKKEYTKELIEKFKASILDDGNISFEFKSVLKSEQQFHLRFAYAVAGYLGMQSAASLVTIDTTYNASGTKTKVTYEFNPALFSAFHETMIDTRKMINRNLAMKPDYAKDEVLFDTLTSKDEEILIALANYAALIMSNRLYGQTVKRTTIYNIQQYDTEKNNLVMNIMVFLNRMGIIRSDLRELYRLKF